MSLQMKRQPRLLDVGQRDSAFDRPASGSSTATSDPASPSTARIFASNRPPCSGRSTFAQRPTNRRHSAGVRSGRSPGDDTCNTYCGDTSSLPSSRASSARDARAQSSTVTARRRADRCEPRSAAALRATAPQLDEIEPDRVKLRYDNSFQRVLHISSRKSSRIKKCGEPPPHFTRGHKGRAAMKR